MSQYFPKLYEPFGGDINVKVDLFNFTTETDIKNIWHIDISSFALKSNLASSKTEVDKLDIDKLVPVAVDLSKLSDVVKNDVVKKTIYNKSVAQVNSIDTSRFVLKTKFDTDKTELKNKIPVTSGLVKKTDYNAKIIEIEGKIPSISGLATNAELTAVENKIPNIRGLVKETDYDTKITEIEKNLTDHNHDKYITTPEFNTLAADFFNARSAQANLLVENELEKLNTFHSNYFRGKSHFEEDGTQNYLVFQPINRYFKVIANIFYHGNLKDYLTKLLSLLLHLIIVFLH